MYIRKVFRAVLRQDDLALEEVLERTGLPGLRGKSMGAKVVVVSVSGSGEESKGTSGLNEVEPPVDCVVVWALLSASVIAKVENRPK